MDRVADEDLEAGLELRVVGREDVVLRARHACRGPSSASPTVSPRATTVCALAVEDEPHLLRASERHARAVRRASRRRDEIVLARCATPSRCKSDVASVAYVRTVLHGAFDVERHLVLVRRTRASGPPIASARTSTRNDPTSGARKRRTRDVRGFWTIDLGDRRRHELAPAGARREQARQPDVRVAP